MKKNRIFGSVTTVALRVLGICALLAGLYLIVGGVRDFAGQQKQKDWIMTTATVSDLSSRRSNGSTVFDVTYQYDAGGATHSGILYGRRQPLLLGDTVRIKYDPAAPKKSTDILSPRPSDLILFLVCGAVFATAGFFLSGAWALIGRIRRRGEPPAEGEPPEAYLAPEEIEVLPRKKPGAALFLHVAVIALVLGGVFLSIRFAPGPKPVDTQGFRQAASAAGYAPTDSTAALWQEWRVGSLLVESASVNNGDLRVDFCVFDSSNVARLVYDGMGLPVTQGQPQETDRTNYARVSVDDGERCAMKLWSGRTVIYVIARSESREDAARLLQALGYAEEETEK